MRPVEAWNYPHAIVMHTLLPGWTWIGNLSVDDLLAKYRLNRVIALMGSRNGDLVDEPLPVGYAHTLEYDAAANAWKGKNAPATGRVYSNAVVLPDGSIIVEGGQSDIIDGGLEIVGTYQTSYRNTVDRFDPGPDADALGTWTPWAATPNLPGENFFTPRGYHHVALLLPDGSVAVMGGRTDHTSFSQNPITLFRANSQDSMEIFKPPYFFTGSRPALNGTPGVIHYGQSFCLIQSVQPGLKYVLIAPGSATHHFDYGQRYIELLWRAGGDCPYIEVMAPPTATMAPEGYYLLFRVVNGVPSVGRYVKLTF